MAVTLNEFGNPEGGARDRLSRVLGVTSAIYGLLGLLSGAAAVAGVLGLAGLQADASAADAARMLALPWSLAASPAEGADAMGDLLVVAGGLTVNLLILIVGSRLARGRLRG